MREPEERPDAAARRADAERWLPRGAESAARAVPLAVTAVVVVWALQWARPFVLPLLAAVFFALLVSPLVDRLRRLRIPRTLAAALAMGLVLGSLGVVVDRTIEPARDWLDRAPQLLRDVERRVRPLRHVLAKVESVTSQAERVTSGAPSAVPVVTAAPESATHSVLATTQAVVVNAVTIVVLSFFLLATRPAAIARAVAALRGPQAARRTIVAFAALRSELGRYFGTLALINVGLGLATAGTMALLGMPNPMLWGAMACVLNFVPYLGAATTLSVLTVVALVTFDGLGPVLAVAGAFLLLATIEGQVVQPIAVGRRLAVSPLLVIIALLFFGWLWGIPGLALAVPAVLAVKAVCAHVAGWQPVAAAMGPAPRWTPARRRRRPREPQVAPESGAIR